MAIAFNVITSVKDINSYNYLSSTRQSKSHSNKTFCVCNLLLLLGHFACCFEAQGAKASIKLDSHWYQEVPQIVKITTKQGKLLQNLGQCDNPSCCFDAQGAKERIPLTGLAVRLWRLHSILSQVYMDLTVTIT
jgi:hypothetical protein